MKQGTLAATFCKTLTIVFSSSGDLQIFIYVAVFFLEE